MSTPTDKARPTLPLIPINERPVTCPLTRGFDTPCACGHMSSECTKREDGMCDG